MGNTIDRTYDFWDLAYSSAARRILDTESAFSSINKTLNDAADNINSLDSDRAIYFPHRDAHGAIDTLFEDIGKIKKFIENRSVDAVSELDHNFYVEMDAFIVAMQGMSAENIKLQNNYVIDFPDIVTLSDIFVYSDTFDAIMYDEYVQYLLYQNETGENNLTAENLRYVLERNGVDTVGLTHEQLLRKYMEFDFSMEGYFRDSADYRKYIAYGRPVDYKSIDDIKRQKDFWINLGIGVGITILSIVCPEIGVPLAFAYSGAMVGEAIYGKSIWTGRELSAEERWMDGIFGVFGMVTSGIQLYKMYGTAANAARTLVNASEKYGFELSEDFIAKLGNNAIKNGDGFSAAILNELAYKGNPAAIATLDRVRIETFAKMLEGGSSVDDLLKAGASLDDIKAAIPKVPKGLRPDPLTYLSEEYIVEHLSQFEDGVTKITAQVPIGNAGPPGGTYVMPSSVADEIISQAGGDVRKLEILLGLPEGSLGEAPVRVDIQNPSGLRIPSGNEMGSNPAWIPGGYTDGGIPEAIIDAPKPGQYTATPIN